MMNKKQFTAIVKNILHPTTRLSSPQLIHPHREWLTGLLVTVMIFVASAAWSTQMYFKHQDTNVTVVYEADVVVYREALVNSALESFSVREEKYDSLISSNSVIVIPDNPGLEIARDGATTTDDQTETEMATSSVDVTETLEDQAKESKVAEAGEVSDVEKLISELESE